MRYENMALYVKHLDAWSQQTELDDLRATSVTKR